MAALPLKFFDECCNEPAKPWLIKGVIAEDEDSSWYGAPGSLKSTLLVDLCIHLAAEKDWRGFKTKKQAGVVYMALERASLIRVEPRLREAIQASALRHGVKPATYIRNALWTVLALEGTDETPAIRADDARRYAHLIGGAIVDVVYRKPTEDKELI